MFTEKLRDYSNIDRFILTINKFTQILTCKDKFTERVNPANKIKTDNLSIKEKQKSIQMMRVNHTGEVCAQALYLGQAITARNESKRDLLLQAAIEEKDHLNWCKQRLTELNSRTSFLNPCWFMGSIFIGSIAGLTGDKWSMGFLAETEYQVTAHIDKHLRNISNNDKKSIAILTQMREDELKHATTAVKNGAVSLHYFIKSIMKCTAKVMTITTKYI